MQTLTDETKTEETADTIQEEISRLKSKLNKAVLEEEGEPKKVKFPLANVHVKIERGTTVWRNNVTPPEVLILVAMHQKGAGEMPILDLKLATQVRKELEQQADKEKNEERKAFIESQVISMVESVEMDPRRLRDSLAGRYGAERVSKLFPGSEPTLPTTFRRAMSTGTESRLEGARLFDMQAFGGE